MSSEHDSGHDDIPGGDDIPGDDDIPGSDDSGGNDSDHHKSFKFDIDIGVVTAVYALEDGVWEQKSIDDDGSETYTVEGNDVIRTELKPFGTEITRYSDVDGDGIYLRTAERWDITSPADGSIIPKLGEELRYSPTDGHDLIAVRGGEDCHGGQGADDFVIREATHLRIKDFSHTQGDKLVFDTDLDLSSTEHLASFVTEERYEADGYTVFFGSDVSITLVGIQLDQISWDDVIVLS